MGNVESGAIKTFKICSSVTKPQIIRLTVDEFETQLKNEKGVIADLLNKGFDLDVTYYSRLIKGTSYLYALVIGKEPFGTPNVSWHSDNINLDKE